MKKNKMKKCFSVMYKKHSNEKRKRMMQAISGCNVNIRALKILKKILTITPKKDEDKS